MTGVGPPRRAEHDLPSRDQPLRAWHWDDPVTPLRAWLREGQIVAIPSESSYGLAVDPGNPEAVDRVYRLKERERGKPLLVVAADIDQLAPWVDIESPIVRWAGEHWPAPLTVVVPTRRPLAAAAGGATLAIRIPAHRKLRRLLTEIGFPLTATSANRSGESPVLDPTALRELMSPLPPGVEGLWVVDDGPLPGGLPSTLVDWLDGEPRELRPGAHRLTTTGQSSGGNPADASKSDPSNESIDDRGTISSDEPASQHDDPTCPPLENPSTTPTTEPS